MPKKNGSASHHISQALLALSAAVRFLAILKRKFCADSEAISGPIAKISVKYIAEKDHKDDAVGMS